ENRHDTGTGVTEGVADSLRRVAPRASVASIRTRAIDPRGGRLPELVVRGAWELRSMGEKGCCDRRPSRIPPIWLPALFAVEEQPFDCLDERIGRSWAQRAEEPVGSYGDRTRDLELTRLHPPPSCEIRHSDIIES